MVHSRSISEADESSGSIGYLNVSDRSIDRSTFRRLIASETGADDQIDTHVRNCLGAVLPRNASFIAYLFTLRFRFLRQR